MNKNYDIIIIGGGHAGIEAAIIAAKKKIKILLITNNIENIGSLSCNPSIGGVGKGQLVKELNSLGGSMGKIADISGIQHKILNSSKGEAVKSTRIQVDRIKYKKYTKKNIKFYKNIDLKQETAKKILIKNNKIYGVITNIKKYFSKIIILTTGTFLNGTIYIGLKKKYGGRIDEKTSNFLANQLKELNCYAGRLKTGTPPRIDGKSINFKKLKKQKGDNNPVPYFSDKIYKKSKKQIYCWLTKTNTKTHEIIKNSLNKSPIFNKNLSGTSPRYCPSIEDKIYRFYNKKSHNIFLEPESNYTNEYYPNGISTSLPYKIQEKFLNSIKGLEKSKIIKPGYGVEYDFFDPKNLQLTLESKIINGLFFAGQINGTTGYEEAAAQGLIAGINAVLKINNKKNLILKKENSYIGLMINDLIKFGVNEPYRIFISRSDNQIYLRENNTNQRFIKYIKKIKNINFKNKILYINYILKKIENKNFNNKYLKPIFIYEEILLNKIKKYIYIYIKYLNYIKKNKKKNINKNFKIKNINYFNIKNIPNEIKEKLNKIKPKNIKELIKIPNINNNIFKNIIKIIN